MGDLCVLRTRKQPHPGCLYEVFVLVRTVDGGGLNNVILGSYSPLEQLLNPTLVTSWRKHVQPYFFRCRSFLHDVTRALISPIVEETNAYNRFFGGNLCSQMSPPEEVSFWMRPKH